MSRSTVTSAIASLEAIGRTRALTDFESIRLERMLRVGGRKSAVRSHGAERSPPRGAAVAALAPIGERLDATIARMLRDHQLVRAIYLNPTDLQELVSSGAIGSSTDATYRGYPVRHSRSATAKPVSRIYSTRGVARNIRSDGA